MCLFFFKQKTAYEMRISDWSSDVCSSDLLRGIEPLNFDPELVEDYLDCFQSYSARTQAADEMATLYEDVPDAGERLRLIGVIGSPNVNFTEDDDDEAFEDRSEEHTSELQSLMRISYAVFCLKKKNNNQH